MANVCIIIIVKLSKDIRPGRRPHHSNALAFLPGPSGWGSTSPNSPPVDNGTAAWGKTTEAPATWGDPGETAAKTSGWGNPSANPVKPGEGALPPGSSVLRGFRAAMFWETALFICS